MLNGAAEKRQLRLKILDTEDTGRIEQVRKGGSILPAFVIRDY